MRSEPLLILLLILGAPSNHAGRNSTGIWGVNRQGCRFSRPAPWMARGGGPPNHWRITGTPSLSEVPSGGARAFCLLLRCSKVSRRQGGTLGGRYRRNGYVHNPTVLAVRPSSQASQLPQFDCWVSGRLAPAVRPPSQASQLPHWSGIAHRISAWHRSPVGAGLPAKAACQSLNIQLNHRYRRQAPIFSRVLA